MGTHNTNNNNVDRNNHEATHQHEYKIAHTTIITDVLKHSDNSKKEKLT